MLIIQTVNTLQVELAIALDNIPSHILQEMSV